MDVNFKILIIPVDQIDFGVTCSGFDHPPKDLLLSIKSVGILQPLVVIGFGKRWRIVCGNRRLKIARELSLPNVPAFFLPDSLSEEEQLQLNLEDNRLHRYYSDVEKAIFFSRLRKFGVNDDRIIDKYMPILRLQPAKKLLIDYLKIDEFSESLKKTLNELNIPQRAVSVLSRWNLDSRTEMETIINVLRPGVNKVKDLLETFDEIARREGVSPLQIIRSTDVQSVLKKDRPLFSELKTVLFALRWPNLHKLRKEVWMALDELKLEPGTKIKTDENFERDDIYLELNFKTLEEFQSQVEKLTTVSRSQGMKVLIKIFQKLKGNK